MERRWKVLVATSAVVFMALSDVTIKFAYYAGLAGLTVAPAGVPSGARCLSPPQQQGHDHRPQVQTRRGHHVLVPLRAGLTEPPLENPRLAELAQPVRQHVVRDAEAGAEVLEPPRAVQRVPHDQQRPALTHHFERPGDRADLTFVRTRKHAAIVRRLHHASQ